MSDIYGHCSHGNNYVTCVHCQARPEDCQHVWEDRVDHRTWDEYFQWTECTKCGKQK